MFGYIIPNHGQLTEEEKVRYRGYYCGLCHALKNRHGQVGRTTLSYDMTFFAIFLNSLYEPDMKESTERCAIHPVKDHLSITSEITDYAADMNLALAYLKRVDDWEDDKNTSARSQARLLRKSFLSLEKQYPRQLGAMHRELKDLSVLEKQNSTDLDACSGCFGRLMAEMFVMKEDEWADTVRKVGAGLGKFIYLLDAWDDLEDDVKKNRFNPFRELRERGAAENMILDILTLPISECTAAFECLPLVQDIDILRNILYSGVWGKYYAKKSSQEKGKSK